jgi:PAS domain S-box-containing protein
MLIGLLAPLIGIALIYANGIIPLMFAPFTILLTLLAYRGRYVWALATTLVLAWGGALFLGSGEIAPHYSARIFAVSLALIWPLHTLLSSGDWSGEIRVKALSQLFLVLAVLELGVIAQVATARELIPIAILELTLVSFWWLFRKADRHLSLPKARFFVLFISVLSSAAILNSGFAPAMLVPLFSLMVYLALPRTEALFFSIASVILGSYAYFSQTNPAQYLEPLFMRWLPLSLIFITAMHQMSILLAKRSAQAKQGADSAMSELLIILATSLASFALLFVIDHGFDAHLRQFPLPQEEINALTMDAFAWLLISWTSASFLINYRRLQRKQVELEQITQHADLTSLQLEFATRSAGMGVFLHNLDTGEVSTNVELNKLFEVDTDVEFGREQMMSKVHPQDRERLKEFRQRHTAEQTPGTIEHRLLLDNKVKWIRSTLSFEKNTKGEMLTSIAMFDISDLMERELELNSAYDGLAQAGIGIEWFDARTGAYLKVSEQLAQMHGMSVEDFDGLHLWDIDTVSTPENYPLFIEKLTQNGVTKLTSRHRKRDGSEFSVSVDIIYQDSASPTLIVFIRDITEQLQQSAQLERALKELEQRRDRQAQMFSIIGHELRTPLASIRMMYDAINLEQQQPYGAQIVQTHDSVMEILNDLRIVVQPDKAKEQNISIDSPAHAVERTLGSMREWLATQGFVSHLSYDVIATTSVELNAGALRQIITNLVKNAAIHSGGSDSWVTLKGCIDGESLNLCIDVEDNGLGIAETKRAAIFEAFGRGDSKAEGTGLGLYIIRELTDLLNGQVSYFESDRGGAGFRVECALALSTQVSIAPTEASDDTGDNSDTYSLAGKRILFAEDQLTLQLLTKSLLEKAGAQPSVASNGVEALATYEAQPFDLVLTDAMMPEMDGYELSRTLRQRGFKGPIVAVTAAVIGDETEKLKEAGVDVVLAKPINVERLKAELSLLATDEES